MTYDSLATVVKRIAFIAWWPLTLACDSPSSSPQPTASSRIVSSSPRIEIIPFPGSTSEVRDWIRSQRERAASEGRVAVVYVGAPWCEPCQRFHDAVTQGKLDARFPTLRLLEFDRDQHEKSLQEAGCLSELIPLLAKPTEQNTCSHTRVEGGIKGDGAVGFIASRLDVMMRK